jgi:hypothetical protein
MTPDKLKEVFDAAQLLWYSVNIAGGAAVIWWVVDFLNNASEDVFGKPLPGNVKAGLAYIMSLAAPVIIYAGLVDGGLVPFDMKGAALVIVASLKLANAMHESKKFGRQRAEKRARAAEEGTERLTTLLGDLRLAPVEDDVQAQQAQAALRPATPAQVAPQSLLSDDV